MSGTAANNTPTIHFEGSCPILRVQDLPASLAYYVDVLGFKVNWNHHEIMAGISRDRAHLMLCHGEQGNPGTWVWVGVSDAAALYKEYLAAGANIALAPTNYPWAYEIHVQDPDGHVLRFGSEPLDDQPFSEWVLWYRDR